MGSTGRMGSKLCWGGSAEGQGSDVGGTMGSDTSGLGKSHSGGSMGLPDSVGSGDSGGLSLIHI